MFQCFNCENVHGTRLAAQFKSPKDVKKKRSDTGNKRQRSCDFLGSRGSGQWTNFECAVLVAVIINILSLTVIVPTVGSITKLFNYVVGSGHHPQFVAFIP